MLKKSILNGVVYPCDWSVVNLGKTINIFRGGSPRPIQSYLTTSSKGINWIKIGDVKKGSKFIERTEEKIISEAANRSRRVYVGDFLLSNSMSFGRPYILNIDGCIHDGWLVLQDYSKSFNKDYLYYILGSDVVISQYISKAAGSSVLNLNKDIVASVNLPCPQINEQALISKALSDIDNLISSLNMLIEKKKALKQGTMQELLTGKRRIDGFEEDWININLSEYSKIKARIGWQGLTTEEYLEQGYAYLVTGTDFLDGRIDWDNCHFVNEERFAQDKNIQIMNGDILITKDGTIGKVAYVMNLNSCATLNSGVFVIRAKTIESYNSGFVYYILKSSIFTDFLNKLSAGSTINHLYQKDFVNFTFEIPQDLEEQKAIAEILFDMDSEITTLQSKLLKYRQIKQGMIQELLTGRIRLL